MNFKFKKPPFYFYIILWIVALALGLQLDKKIQNLSDLFGLVVLIMPITFAYIWVLKNKIKILNFYKKIRKKIKHVFYTIESLICLFIIGVIISIITLGGFNNFRERVAYEIINFKERNGECARSYYVYFGDTIYSQFYWKKNTQFVDYFKDKPDKFIKEIIDLKNDSLFEFNACVAIGHALKAAHKDNQVAKDFLASIPFEMTWKFDTFYMRFFRGKLDYEDVLSQRYINELDENKLYNPALLNAYAYKDLNDKQKARKYYKLAAEEGYLQGMDDYLFSLSKEEKINKNECQFILKYNNHLANENSIMHSFNIINSKIGRLTDYSKHLFECNEKKIDFASYIEMSKNLIMKIKDPKPSSNHLTTYPALIYFNGWGNVDENKDLAINLFKKNIESKNGSKISKAYIALNNLNSNNSKSFEEADKLLNEILEKDISMLSYLEKIDEVKLYILNWIRDWFKNPELVKSLNLYG